MRPISLFILATLIYSCSNFSKPTEKEEAAVQIVIDYYGGKCIMHKGTKTHNGNKQTYFTLEISDSDYLDLFAEVPHIPASNAAYLFYSNLGTEKKNYTHVEVELHFGNGKSEVFYYAGEFLLEFEEHLPLFNEVTNQFLSQNYQGLEANLDSKFLNKLDTSIVVALTVVDEEFGVVRESNVQGFFKEENSSDGLFITYYATHVRDSLPVSFQVTFHPVTEKILSMDFLF